MVNKTHMMGLVQSTLMSNLPALITRSSIPFTISKFTVYNRALFQMVKKSFMTGLSYWIFQHWLQAPPSQLISTPSPWLGWPQPRYKSRGWPGAHRAAVKLPSLIWGPLQSQGLFLTAEKLSKTHLVSIRLPRKGYFGESFMSGVLCYNYGIE